jgi:hypothetical protein
MIDGNKENDSKFVGSLLELVFDEKTLFNSSATGKSPKGGVSARKKLNDKRLTFIKGKHHTKKNC